MPTPIALHLGEDLRAERRARNVQQVLPECRLVRLVVEADRLELLPSRGAGFSVACRHTGKMK